MTEMTAESKTLPNLAGRGVVDLTTETGHQVGKVIATTLRPRALTGEPIPPSVTVDLGWRHASDLIGALRETRWEETLRLADALEMAMEAATQGHEEETPA